MSSDVLRELFVGIVLVIGSFIALIKWILTKFLKELKPNGGSSLKDQTNRLETRVDDIFHILGEGDKK